MPPTSSTSPASRLRHEGHAHDPRRAIAAAGGWIHRPGRRTARERHRRQAAVVADRVCHHAFGALLAQRTVFQIEEGADRALLFTQLLELVFRHARAQLRCDLGVRRYACEAGDAMTGAGDRAGRATGNGGVRMIELRPDAIVLLNGEMVIEFAEGRTPPVEDFWLDLTRSLGWVRFTRLADSPGRTYRATETRSAASPPPSSSARVPPVWWHRQVAIAADRDIAAYRQALGTNS